MSLRSPSVLHLSLVRIAVVLLHTRRVFITAVERFVKKKIAAISAKVTWVKLGAIKLAEKNKRAKSTYQQREIELGSATAEKFQLKTLLEESDTTEEVLEQDAKAKEERAAHMQSSNLPTHQQLIDTHQKVERAQKALQRQKHRLEERQELISSLNVTVQECRRKSEGLKKKLASARSFNSSLLSAQRKLSDQIESARARILVTNAECRSIERTIREISAMPAEKKCAMCMEGFLEMLLRPCMHISVCGKCSKRLTDCPVCRKAPTSMERVFL